MGKKEVEQMFDLQRKGIGVGLTMSDGSIKVIHIQHGSPVNGEYLPPDEMLEQFYTTKESVEALIRLGSLTSIGPEPTLYDPETNPDGKCHKGTPRNLSWIKNLDKYTFKSKDDYFKNGIGEMATYYLYLFDAQKQEWYSLVDYNHDHSVFAKVKDAIADFIDNFTTDKKEDNIPELSADTKAEEAEIEEE